MKRSKVTTPDVLGLLVRQMEREGLPLAVREHRFHEVRRWRFDLAYPDLKIAFEYEGGIHSYGAHSRGKGFAKDVEKYNTAGMLGWRVFRIHGDMVYRHNREIDEGWILIRDVLFELEGIFMLEKAGKPHQIKKGVT